MARSSRVILPASLFGMVLGLSGLGQAWHLSVALWGMPAVIGEGVQLLAVTIWAVFMLLYLVQAIRYPSVIRDEFIHPIAGSMPALMGISTLLIAIAALPYSRLAADILTAIGIAWQLFYALWHTGRLWQSNQDATNFRPTFYLPTVAGNFVSASALGALGLPNWGWLFLGAGWFFWLALESLVIQRLWHQDAVPVAHRPLLGIQFAPASVCAMAWLNLAPLSSLHGALPDHWLLMLWGCGLFQLLLGLRLSRWLAEQPFTPAYWAYTFGAAAVTVAGLKLAVAGVDSAQLLIVPVFVLVNLFIGYVLVRTAGDLLRWMTGGFKAS